jgi:hypothetical protein
MAFPPHEDYDSPFRNLSDKEKLKRVQKVWNQSSENNNVHENYNERIKFEESRIREAAKEDGIDLTIGDLTAILGTKNQQIILHELVSIRAVLEKIESKLDNKK